MHGPKVTVIGAGSYFFGKPVITRWPPALLWLVGRWPWLTPNPARRENHDDTRRTRLRSDKMRVNLVGSTDRRQVMAGSDFIVLTFANRNAHFRGIDTQIAAKHGIRMCSSDTIGPGGIFRALREAPPALAMAKDAHELAPDAWVINFVNPAAVLGMTLRRYAPEVKSFALCDAQHEPYCTLRYLKMVGILPDDATAVPPEVQAKLDLAIGGVNHITFLLRFRYDGQDMFPKLRQVIAQEADEERRQAQEHSKARFNSTYALQLFDLYGVYPTVVGHTKEYVPFYQGYGVAANDPEPLRLFDAERRMTEMAAAWKTTEQYASGEISVDQFLQGTHNDHATDIIESMWSGLGKAFYINTPNGSAIPNMPADAFLELRSHLDMRGVQPLPVGSFPRGALALPMPGP